MEEEECTRTHGHDTLEMNSEIPCDAHERGRSAAAPMTRDERQGLSKKCHSTGGLVDLWHESNANEIEFEEEQCNNVMASPLSKKISSFQKEVFTPRNIALSQRVIYEHREAVSKKSSQGSAYSMSSNTPGVLKTNRKASQESIRVDNVKFFTHKFPKHLRPTSIYCGYCFGKVFKYYGKAFRYVVLFKFCGEGTRKKLTIPMLLSFWVTVGIALSWAYNGIFYWHSSQLLEKESKCLVRCLDGFFPKNDTCLELLSERLDNRLTDILFMLVNSLYITLYSFFVFHFVMAITRTLRNLGRALQDVLKKKHFSDILKHMSYSEDDATAEMASVIPPLRSLFQQGVNFARQAEIAESKWSEVNQKAKLLEALLNMKGEDDNGQSDEAHSLSILPPSNTIKRRQFRTLFHKQSDLKIFTTTWNVGNTCPSSDIGSWLGNAYLYDIVAVGVQECTYNVKGNEGAQTSAFQKAGQKLLKSAVPNYGCAADFEARLSKCLGNEFYLENKAFISGNDSTLQDVASIRLFVFVHKRHSAWVKTITKSTVKRGVTMTLNKGAVAISLMVYGMRIAFINSHFHAHQNKVEERNKDFKAICKKLMTKANMIYGGHPMEAGKLSPVHPSCSHHLVIWMGDLNYRIDLPHSEVVNSIWKCQDGKGDWEDLFAFDQLNEQRTKGACFTGYQEKEISFMPSYKLNADRSGYDLQRTPAWCDRILWKAIAGLCVNCLTYDSDYVMSTSDHHPVRSTFHVSHILPILDKPCTEERSLQVWGVTISFFFSSKVGQTLFKSYNKYATSEDYYAVEADNEEQTVVLSNDNLPDNVPADEMKHFTRDLSLLAPFFALSFCGKMIKPKFCESWSGNMVNLDLELDIVEMLPLFPEPIIVGVYIKDPDIVPLTGRPAAPDAAADESGNQSARADTGATEELKAGMSHLVAEGLISTIDYFKNFSENRAELCSRFETELMWEGEKVGSISGTLAIKSKSSRPLSPCPSTSSLDNMGNFKSIHQTL